MAKILVVDDDPDILDLLDNFLSKEGHSVILAPGGEEALVAFRAARFDLILTDIQMPGKHGFALLEDIRGGTTIPPVILMTGYPSHKGILDSVVQRAFAYVEKPFDLAYLLSLVNQALSIHAAQTGRISPSRRGAGHARNTAGPDGPRAGGKT